MDAMGEGRGGVKVDSEVLWLRSEKDEAAI